MRIIVTKEDYGNFYFNATTEADLSRNAFKILKQRFEDGFWYDEDDDIYKEIKYVVENNIYTKAWYLLKRRSDADYEYERVYIANVIE